MCTLLLQSSIINDALPGRSRGVVPGGAGGAGGAMASPDFGRSVNPISTRETDYARLITTGTP